MLPFAKRCIVLFGLPAIDRRHRRRRLKICWRVANARKARKLFTKYNGGLSRADDNFYNWNASRSGRRRSARNKWKGHSLGVYVRVRKSSRTKEALNGYERGAFSSAHSLLLCTTLRLCTGQGIALSEKWFLNSSFESLNLPCVDKIKYILPIQLICLVHDIFHPRFLIFFAFIYDTCLLLL